MIYKILYGIVQKIIKNYIKIILLIKEDLNLWKIKLFELFNQQKNQKILIIYLKR